ncbi:synaptotagmin-like protein 1 isoform X3 [Alosa sapidissima]|uniref:synaptotagmin-like protein 1 isoform X3 n=1 Tax=Alosa sapidissima TaxID=34773 RepID=UPI001C081E66|nr:synaptotagmin-like protein 1 isoform X3 [Alosa sapidissima]
MEVELGELTDEEAAVILDVLERDKELQKQEERRLCQLEKTECDPLRLRQLSGTWFTEERDRRHQRGGVDIVHSSIRQKRCVKDIPLTTVFEKQTDIECKQTAEEDDDDRDEKEEEDHEKGSQTRVPPTPRPRIRTPLQLGVNCKDEHEKNSENKVVSTHGDVSPLGRDDPTPSSLQDTDSISILELDPIRIGSTSSLQYNTTWNGSVTSLMSVGEIGDAVVSGRIQFSLQYHHHKEELVVYVYRCQDLAQARRNRTNPYVKVYLLPDMSSQSKRKTSVKKKTVNPIYNEIFTYKVADIRGRVLSLSVWHTEALRANVFLGAVEAQLNQWDWDKSQPCWHSLQPRFLMDPAMGTTTGTILLSMKFVPPGAEGSGLPPTGELHIWLREAAVISSKQRVPSTFVKSCVLPDENRSSGQRTRVVRRSASPVFNHTMVYDGIHASDLTHICVEMTVWDKHALAAHCLGGVRFSTGAGVSYDQTVLWMDSSEEEQKVWMAVMNNHNRWVETALPLRTELQPYT